ncbi:MAG: SUMF1/EgtB/PvdO family nonheme iron enzyme [Fuerstiella sp.]
MQNFWITFTLASLLALSFSHAVEAGGVTFGSGANTFNMEFVEIGSPGNADDTTGNPNPAGKVDYTYQMGKFEVSEDMITKFNASQSLTITKDTRGTDKPATSVSWNEAARFVNWLNTSQGFQAAYNFTTGGVNDNISLWSSANAWQLGGENLFRHKDARYWLPSMDEWYKAAYYDPNTSTYFNFPTGSNTAPTAVASGTAAGTAVYDQTFGTGPADITQAGGLSPFGIMGLGGNVFEWEETTFNLANGSGSSSRGVRGGSWSHGNPHVLSVSGRLSISPADENFNVGFRVASLSSTAAVPEPGSFALWLTGLAGLGWYKRKRLRK